MSFPGTYNISYYYGDTLEFRVYPKNSSGEIFDLSSFETSRFTIAPTRGADLEDQIFGYATISSDQTNILCAIRPEDSSLLTPGTTYVYDIEISKTSEASLTPYDLVYTLLTGNISITEDVTKPGSNPPLEIPGPATDLNLLSSGSSTLSVSWTAPTTGGTPSAYKLAVLRFTSDETLIESAINSSELATQGSQTSYTFFGLRENATYSVVVLPLNTSGNALFSNLLTNSSAYTTADNPFTPDPDFVVTNGSNTSFLIDGVSNDDINLVRGVTYLFEIDSSGQPFWIQTSPSEYTPSDVYSVGVTNNGSEVGSITWTVPAEAPDTLFYISENQASMKGSIQIIDGGS